MSLAIVAAMFAASSCACCNNNQESAAEPVAEPAATECADTTKCAACDTTATDCAKAE